MPFLMKKFIQMKKTLLLILTAVMSLSLFAQQANVQKVTIKTNGTCEHCKKVMMDNVPQWKGVKECTYNLQTSEITISYDASKTSVSDLRTGISKLGYDADNVKADAAARAKLPTCCTQAKQAGHSSCGGGCSGHHDDAKKQQGQSCGNSCGGHHDDAQKQQGHSGCSGCGGHH